jgi:hypothetical protein
VADNPNSDILAQIHALLDLIKGEQSEPDSESLNAKADNKGVIKDDENKKKELSPQLSGTEKSRLEGIGKVLAIAIGQELQIGKYKPGPEAGRLKMEQTKVGGAVNIPPPSNQAKEASRGLGDWLKGLADLLKNLLKFAWPALLLTIGIGAAALYDELGALGRGLSKMALKLAPYMGKIARFGGKIVKGIGRLASGLGRLVSSLGDAFKYLKTKGIAGLLDDLKLKLPKTLMILSDFFQILKIG